MRNNNNYPNIILDYMWKVSIGKKYGAVAFEYGSWLLDMVSSSSNDHPILFAKKEDAEEFLKEHSNRADEANIYLSLKPVKAVRLNDSETKVPIYTLFDYVVGLSHKYSYFNTNYKVAADNIKLKAKLNPFLSSIGDPKIKKRYEKNKNILLDKFMEDYGNDLISYLDKNNYYHTDMENIKDHVSLIDKFIASIPTKDFIRKNGLINIPEFIYKYIYLYPYLNNNDHIELNIILSNDVVDNKDDLRLEKVSREFNPPVSSAEWLDINKNVNYLRSYRYGNMIESLFVKDNIKSLILNAHDLIRWSKKNKVIKSATDSLTIDQTKNNFICVLSNSFLPLEYEPNTDPNKAILAFINDVYSFPFKIEDFIKLVCDTFIKMSITLHPTSNLKVNSKGEILWP